jgi:hypothetical protein
MPSIAGDPFTLSISDTIDLTAGDYVELVVWQNSGGALNVGSTRTFFGMELIGV